MWGKWLRTPGTEENKCSSHWGKSLICFGRGGGHIVMNNDYY